MKGHIFAYSSNRLLSIFIEVIWFQKTIFLLIEISKTVTNLSRRFIARISYVCQTQIDLDFHTIIAVVFFLRLSLSQNLIYVTNLSSCYDK